VRTVEEKLVRPLLLEPVSMNDLNKSLFMSDNLFVSNLLYGSFRALAVLSWMASLYP